MLIHSSWDNLRHTLESLPGKQDNLRKMNLDILPTQEVDVTMAAIDDDSYERIDVNKMLTGNLCPELIEDGDLDEDIEEGTDVVVYTEVTRKRPWVGRVSELLPNKKFIIHWYQRRSGRGNTFNAMKNFDGSPYLTEQDFQSIMFWEMSEKRTKDSFNLSNFWLVAIRQEYEKLDAE